MKKERVVIAAVSENGIIGRNGQIPWKISADLKHFRELTIDNTVVMGRKTYESLGKSLDGRTNIVVSRNGFDKIPSKNSLITVCHSIESALLYASYLDGTIFIMGGGEVYKQVMDRGLVDRLEITEVNQRCDGDTYFPKINKDEWEEFNRESFSGFSFVTYLRK